MKTCEKCSVDLIHDPGRGGWPREREGAAAHTPERCRDRLAVRLAEVERAMAAGYESQIAALRAELAECRAELERANELRQLADDLRRDAVIRCESAIGMHQAAEARAERYETVLRRIDRGDTGEGLHKMIRVALAETEKEKP